jgi:hypothetical protein
MAKFCWLLSGAFARANFGNAGFTHRGNGVAHARVLTTAFFGFGVETRFCIIIHLVWFIF